MKSFGSSAPVDNDLLEAIQSDTVWQAKSGHDSEELVVFVHGYGTTPESYSGLLGHFHSLGLDTYAPAYPAGPFSAADPLDATDHLANKIESRARGRRRILLCAHSMGCVFLKAAVARLFHKEFRSPDGSAPSDEWTQRAKNGDIRMLLPAGTNRGYKPRQREIGWAQNGLHCWFWLTLIGILWGHWLRCGAIQTENQDWWKCVSLGFSVATTLAGVVAAIWFQRLRCFAWQGALWAATMIAWAWWGSIGGTFSWATASVAAIATSVATYSLSQLFGFNRRASGVHAALIASFVAWTYYSPLNITLLWPATLTLILCCILYPWKSGLLVENVLQGSSWVSGVRLRWMDFFQLYRDRIQVVHIFGEDDMLVDDDDYEELSDARESSQYALSGGTHLDFMLTPRTGKEDADSQRHPAIREFIERFVQRQELPPVSSNAHTEREPAFQWRPVRENPSPGSTPEDARLIPASSGAGPAESLTTSREKHVVILIHGIRDFGEWQDSLADRIRQKAKVHGVELLDVVVVRYGYFTAFQFLMSSERDRATRSFLDAYAQVRTRYPNSKVHVAAHSNGTFVVCNALSKEKGYVRLDNIYFAGSVVSPRFPWQTFGPSDVKSSVLGRIRSDCATMDWPVGALCHTLSLFGLLNWFVSRYPFWASTLSWGRIGAGGVDGFVYGQDLPSDARPQLSQTQHLVGDHGVAIRAKYHDGIADFLLTGKPVKEQPNGRIDQLFRWGRIGFALIGLLMVAGLYGITIMLASKGGDTWAVMNGALLTIVVVRIMMSI